MADSKDPHWTDFGDRNPRVGEPVIWLQNGEKGRVAEERIDSAGAYVWRVRFESGYEAWFPREALAPNREVS